MQYSSTIKFTTPAAPEVTFTLRKMSHGRRIALNLTAAKALQAVGEIEGNMKRVEAEISRAEQAAKIEPCSCTHGDLPLPEGVKPEAIDPNTQHYKDSGMCPQLDCHCREPHPDPQIGTYLTLVELGEQRATSIVEELYPAYIRWGVESIEGMEIDGYPATVDLLLDNGSEMIIGELGREIQRVIRMSPEEVLGFKLPSTSGARTDGLTNGTSAPIASESVSTRTGIAAVTTPA